MRARSLIIGLSLATCCVMLCLVGIQRARLLDQRAEQQKRLAVAAATASIPDTAAPGSAADLPTVSHELLQLRNQVGQLRRQRDELLPVRAEHDRLLFELTARGTNASALPTNYIRKAQAQLVGYNSPEETAQSFLYAVRNRDVATLLEALIPAAASWYTLDSNRINALFEESQAFIGLALRDKKRLRPDLITTSAEILPGLTPIPMNFRLVNGQWKLEHIP